MSARLTESMRGINALLQAGRYREAQSQLQALVAANPHYVEGLRLLAGTMQVLGAPAEAERLLRRALAIDASWTPTLTSLAELLLATGRGAEAVPLLQRAIAGTPRYPRAALLLVRHLLGTGQAAAALGVATPWCSAGPVDAELSALHVAAYAALGRKSEAVAHYRRLVELAPDDANAALTLATALNTAGQAQEAERVARESVSRTPAAPALLYTHACSLIALEQFDRAERTLQDCVRAAPRHTDAHNSLAQLVWMRTGDSAEMTRALDEAIASCGGDAGLLATKAALLQGAGEARAAYACLADVAARPGTPPTLLVRAGLAALEFEPGTALGLAERALRAQPDSLPARKLLCSAYLGVGDAAKALAECALLQRASPDDQYLIAMQTTALRLANDARYELLCDYDRMVLAQFLETPPGWSDLPSFLTDLAARLSGLHNPHGHRLLYQSLRHGTETTQDLSRSEDPVIQALFQAFASPIARYREQIGHGSDPLRRRNRGRSRFNGSWSVRLHRDGYHTSHVHPRGWISSACYIQLPDSMYAARPSGEGILSFGAPGMLTTPPLAAEFSVRPEVGRLVLFPSYFWHGTLPFQSEQPRLTVAFDVVPEIEA